jgi:transcriptional regulator with XRE-family HTH domain
MSFQISLSPTKRAAGRFIESARRAILKALAEESRDRGLSQSDIARDIGIHRSVVNRELRGYKDMTLGRVAELATAMGREAVLELRKLDAPWPMNYNEVSSRENTSTSSISIVGETSQSTSSSGPVRVGFP